MVTHYSRPRNAVGIDKLDELQVRKRCPRIVARHGDEIRVKLLDEPVHCLLGKIAGIAVGFVILQLNVGEVEHDKIFAGLFFKADGIIFGGIFHRIIPLIEEFVRTADNVFVERENYHEDRRDKRDYHFQSCNHFFLLLKKCTVSRL